MIIGLTGYFGAGKGEIGEYLKTKGFIYHSCSDYLRGELEKLGRPKTIENLITLGNSLRSQFGAGIIPKRLLEQIEAKGEKLVIVDSLRHPDEIAALREGGDFVLVSVDAPIETRYQRIKDRGRPEDKMTYEEFCKQEEFQITGQGSQAQLLAARKLADYNIVNDGTIDELHAKIDDVLKDIGVGDLVK